nr:reverse transcriptase domain-containing protein [Tanacetum cinerariifolium]
MSTNEQTPLIQPTSVVRNTLGKEQVPQNLGGSISDEALREYCDKNYHQILPIIAEKVHQEKVQQEKLKAVKARLNFKESSRHSESGTPSRRRILKKGSDLGMLAAEEKWKSRVIRRKAGRYDMSNRILYKKSFIGPWLRCIGPLQEKNVLREIHEGSCSMHAGPRSVVEKVLRSGYYWPTMHSDAWNLIRECSSLIPVEIRMPTMRTAEVDMIKNDEALEVNLDLLEEKKDQATIQEAKSKAKMEKYYNARVRSTSFRPEDLIYRSNEACRSEDGGKLGPKWEGPYEITKALSKGAYKHRDRNGNTLPRTWNVCILKKCYVHEM